VLAGHGIRESKNADAAAADKGATGEEAEARRKPKSRPMPAPQPTA